MTDHKGNLDGLKSRSARRNTTKKEMKSSLIGFNALPTHTSVSSAFEADNAKQLSVEKTVRYFVPPINFESLLDAKNHILLGSRGSGKTTWVRMLSHDHVLLASSQNDEAYQYARNALARNVIGIYVPTNIGFVGSLKNKPWQDANTSELFFQWRLNLHSCAALIPIIRSCIDYYVQDRIDRKYAELEICNDLSGTWTRGRKKVTTLESLGFLLATMESERLDGISMLRARQASVADLNDYFDAELFQPIRYCVSVISHRIQVPASALWMLCLDEAEYLTESHHRILNTHIRAASGNFVFKIATMPFAHHTLLTNVDEPIREGHDFEYVYVDQEPIDSRGAQDDSAFLRFARDVFARRLRGQPGEQVSMTLQKMLGASELIDEKPLQGEAEIDEFMKLLSKYANDLTYLRAARLLATDKTRFRNEIQRKVHGALVLRNALRTKTGNAKMRAYSGEGIVIRCSDGNARRLVRLLNTLLKRLEQTRDVDQMLRIPLDQSVQNEVLVSIARDTLNRVQSEPPNGFQTYKFLMAIGKYMEHTFSARRLGSDFVSSIEVKRDDGPAIQQFVKQAVQLSLLTPSRINAHNGPSVPCEGVFHLAFLFAPLFGLLPRRNKAQRLPKILAFDQSSSVGEGQQKELEI